MISSSTFVFFFTIVEIAPAEIGPAGQELKTTGPHFRNSAEIDGDDINIVDGRGRRGQQPPLPFQTEEGNTKPLAAEKHFPTAANLLKKKREEIKLISILFFNNNLVSTFILYLRRDL